MRTQKLGPIIGCFASSFLFASTAVADGVFGAISATAVHSDNGNKSSEEKISELQEQYNLKLGARYENTIGKVEADYSAAHFDFSEGTQPNKSTIEGHSALQLGNQAQLAELLIEHSRQTLLNKADSLDLTSNQEERDIFTVTPGLNWHFSSADVLFVKGNFSDIHYLESELNNSTRKGASLGAMHEITEVDTIGLNIQSTDVEFKHFPASNYSLRNATINYSARLRQLSYSLQVGANQSETENGETYDAPSYLASLEYKSGLNTFGLNLAQEITDTSFGGGNKNTSEEPNSIDSGIGQSGQIDRKRIDVQWTTTAVCDRCTLNVGAQKTRDQYLFISQNSNEVSANIVGRYTVSTAAAISVRLTGTEHTFPDKTLGENYKLTTAALEYSYRMGRNFNINASYTDEKRVDENASTGYRAKLIGLGLSYSF
jgi:hypothetical protein